MVSIDVDSDRGDSEGDDKDERESGTLSIQEHEAGCDAVEGAESS